MILSLAQIIAVAGYGNDYLRNGKTLANFSEAHSVFQTYSKVLFKEIILRQNPEESIVANNPVEWFRYLKNDGCACLRLCFRRPEEQRFLDERIVNELTGYDMEWLIEAVYENYSNYWARKTVQDKSERAVVFARIAKAQEITNMQIDNQDVKRRMSELLAELAEFAEAKNLEGFSRQFEVAKMMLDSPNPEQESSLAGLIPVDNYSLVAKQNIFSACRAWVFGGMGSWSDLTFRSEEDYEMYRRLSKKLYKSINEAIMAGVNTF